MNDLIEMQGSLPAIADSTLLQIAEQAEQRVNAMAKIKRVALKMTNASDWIDQSGKPYLQASGGEKVARLFGISWQIAEPVLETEEGGHFSYTYKGQFSLAGATIEAIGTRSSKDGFFKKYEGFGENRTELPPSAIDRGDVKKSAYTNLIGNGVTRLLGIRNLTYADLEEFAGIKKDMLGRVDYKKKGENQEDSGRDSSKISDAQRKRMYAIAKGAGKTDGDIKAYLKTLIGSESTADIPKAKYDETCAWAEKKLEEPGSEG
jgi:hypothetical protein